MRYKPNPKHKDPWQRGRRGALCPKTIDSQLAQRLLVNSEEEGGKRYAVHNGRAYCAQKHGTDIWHGYPVGWVDVPASLRRKWWEAGHLRRRDMQKHWDG